MHLAGVVRIRGEDRCGRILLVGLPDQNAVEGGVLGVVYTDRRGASVVQLVVDAADRVCQIRAMLHKTVNYAVATLVSSALKQDII